jgi:hypothetical protein
MLKTTTTDSGKETTILTHNTYEITRKLVQLWLPALASLYFGLSQIWGLPAGEEVVGTIALVTTFLGVVLGVSGTRYDNSVASRDGQMVVTTDGGGVRNFSLELDGDPERLAEMDSVKFKVRRFDMPLPPG